jgi:RNA polymerase sigma factor (sigma-70 family)
VIVSDLAMMDNPRRERLRRPLMPDIGGRARSAKGAPATPIAPSLRASFVTTEADFLEALPVIDDVTDHVCRRHRLNAAEADEFRSDVRLHFIENNYDVLRRFEGRCALATYVTVVVQRLFFDWRNRMWGRWRPSSEARRLGPSAILLERLIVRDGWTIEQSLDMLRINHQIEIDDTIREFCNTLTARAPARRLVSEDDASEVASPGPSADDSVVLAERDFLAKRVQAALDRARQSLPAMDRLMLKMRFDDGMAVSDIARALHLDQRPMYRTIERLLKAVGAAMLAEGISRAEIDALFAEPPGQWGEPERQAWSGSGPTPTRGARKGASWLRNR